MGCKATFQVQERESWFQTPPGLRSEIPAEQSGSGKEAPLVEQVVLGPIRKPHVSHRWEEVTRREAWMPRKREAGR